MGIEIILPYKMKNYCFKEGTASMPSQSFSSSRSPHKPAQTRSTTKIR